MEKNPLIISPKTKVLQLIETYPELEEVLIVYVPAFKKLQNPLLRKTVAKIATLQQAATIGQVKVEDLINVLRDKVGQNLYSHGEEAPYVTHQPKWFNLNRVTKSFDIREMLYAGEQPVNQVISDLNRLEGNVIYEVISPFIPAPLIDKATSLNIHHWIKECSAQEFRVYFTRNEEKR